MDRISLWIYLQPREPSAGSVLCEPVLSSQSRGTLQQRAPDEPSPSSATRASTALCDALPGCLRRAAEPGVLWLGSGGSEVGAVLRMEQRTTTGWVCTDAVSHLSTGGPGQEFLKAKPPPVICSNFLV